MDQCSKIYSKNAGNSNMGVEVPVSSSFLFVSKGGRMRGTTYGRRRTRPTNTRGEEDDCNL